MMLPTPPRAAWWLCGALTLGLVLPMALGAVSAGEGRVYDLLLRTRRNRPDPSVVLVCLDGATRDWLGGRNPTRSEIARALDNVWAAGADLLGIDLLFGQRKPPDEAGNADLAGALSRADAVLACSPAQGFFPLPPFRREAVGLGSIDLMADPDGIVRTLPSPYAGHDKGRTVLTYLPFALECAVQAWFPSGPPQPRLLDNTLWFGDHPFPMRNGSWLIPFQGGDGILPRLSLKEALRGSSRLKMVKDKIVLVGSTLPSQHDYFSVPLPPEERTEGGFTYRSSNTMAGVELHGQALSALLSGRSITPAGAALRWTLFGAIALLGSLLTLFRLKPFPSLAVWAVSGSAILAGGWGAMKWGRPIPLLGMVLTWAGYAAVSFAYHRGREFREKKAVERLFSRYVSPNVAKALLKRPDLVHLGGRRKELSILFLDIRGFTSMSEKMEPEEVSRLLNLFFGEMTTVLFAHEGTLDKFIGDAILAFFGDPLDQPDHAARCLACAVHMQEKAAELRKRFATREDPPLHIGIGVHTGPVVVGNNGSQENFTYTVIGDTVNLAARLQGLATHDDVIATIQTAERIPDFDILYDNRRMAAVSVKGKREPVPIVSVVGRLEQEVSHG